MKRNIPRGAVIAHEKGHAQAFIEFVKVFADEVKDLACDDMDGIEKVYLEVYKRKQNEILDAANQPTIDWFLSNGYNLEVMEAQDK